MGKSFKYYELDEGNRVFNSLIDAYSSFYKHDENSISILNKRTKSKGNKFYKKIKEDIDNYIDKQGYSHSRWWDFFHSENVQTRKFEPTTIKLIFRLIEFYKNHFYDIESRKPILVERENEGILSKIRFWFQNKLNHIYKYKLYVMSCLLVIGLVFFVKNDFLSDKRDEIIDSKIKLGDKYYETEQYKKALIEYKEIVKDFKTSDIGDNYSDLLFKIGNALRFYQPYDIKKINESILYFKEVEEKLTQGTDRYNYNIIQLLDSYDQLYRITNDVKYLDEIYDYLEKVDTNNIVLKGLVFIFQGIVSQHKKELEKGSQFYNMAIKIFNIDCAPDIYFFIRNSQANILMEQYHQNSDDKNLKLARDNYSEANEKASNTITKAIGEFGLAHVLFHEYDIDSIIGKLYEAKVNLGNTLRIYNLEETPELYSSSNYMLSLVNEKIFFKTKDSTLLNESVKNLEQSLEFYSPLNYRKEYYETLLQLAEINYYLLQDGNGIKEKEILENLNLLNEVSAFFQYDNFPKIYAKNVALIVMHYRMLSEIRESNYFLKKSKGLSKYYFQNQSSILRELTISEYNRIGNKYFLINKNLYILSKEKNDLLHYRAYELLTFQNKDSVKLGTELLRVYGQMSNFTERVNDSIETNKKK